MSSPLSTAAADRVRTRTRALGPRILAASAPPVLVPGKHRQKGLLSRAPTAVGLVQLVRRGLRRLGLGGGAVRLALERAFDLEVAVGLVTDLLGQLLVVDAFAGGTGAACAGGGLLGRLLGHCGSS